MNTSPAESEQKRHISHSEFSLSAHFLWLHNSYFLGMMHLTLKRNSNRVINNVTGERFFPPRHSKHWWKNLNLSVYSQRKAALTPGGVLHFAAGLRGENFQEIPMYTDWCVKGNPSGWGWLTASQGSIKIMKLGLSFPSLHWLSIIIADLNFQNQIQEHPNGKSTLCAGVKTFSQYMYSGKTTRIE